MAIVVPATGKLTETAQALLALTGDPAEVRTVLGGTAFEVPDDLADLYHQYGDSESAPVSRRGRKPRTSKE